MISVAHDALSRRQAIYAHRLFFFWWRGIIHTARARAEPPPPPRLGRAPGSNNEPGGPRCRKSEVESKAVVRIEVRSQPAPLPGLRCGVWSSSVFFVLFFCHSRPSQGQGPGLVIRPGSGAACPRAPPHESTEHGRLAPVAAARTRKGPSACRIRVRGNTTYNDNDKSTNDVHVL
jgi:hypothetical protein